MKPLQIVGVILLAVGAFLFFRGGSYTKNNELVKIGDTKIDVKSNEAIPTWVAGVAAGAGLVLLLAGSRRA
jgi:hypothetical protein